MPSRKRSKHRTNPSSHPQPTSGQKRTKKIPLMPMLFGGFGILALFVGGMLALDHFAPRKTKPSDEPVSTSSSQPSTSSSSQTNTTKTPSQPATRPEKTSSRPSGILTLVPTGDVSGAFAADAELARAFETGRDELLTDKPPMAVRRNLEAVLPKAANNPGREHLLALLAFTGIKTRDAEFTLRQLDSLTQDFPSSRYAPMADAMRLEAEFMKSTGKNATVDSAQLASLAATAQSKAEASSDAGLSAYLRYLAGKAYDQAGQTDKAVALLLELADKAPQSAEAPSALVYAGSVLVKNEQFDQARATLEKMVKTYPTEKSAREARKMLNEIKILGLPAPELSVINWASGDPSPLSAQKGKVVLLVFWQTWCPHCRDELPHLSQLYQEHQKDGLVVIGVTRDDKQQDEAKLNDFLSSNPLPFPIARVESSSRDDYAVTGVPAAALIDKHGIVRYRSHPTQMTWERISSLLKAP